MYNRKDSYYRKAKREGYRSRASYKLLQLNRKFNLMRRGDKVLDLGCAPGGWMQVALETVGEKGLVVGVDLSDIEAFSEKNLHFVRGDVNFDETHKEIREISPHFDVVISDLSPRIIGVWDVDSHNSYLLSLCALSLAKIFLKPKGNFLVKLFSGKEMDEFLKELKKRFRYVKISRPKASRKRSAEIYFVSKGFLRN
ncbi:MAG: RlmE family RNA methyltransferase [Candidatus Methanofastidiosia archaeon]